MAANLSKNRIDYNRLRAAQELTDLIPAAEREDLDRVLEFTAIHAFLLGLRTGTGLGALIPQGTAPSAPGPSACTPP